MGATIGEEPKVKMIIRLINMSARRAGVLRLSLGDNSGAVFFLRIEWLTDEMIKELEGKK